MSEVGITESERERERELERSRAMYLLSSSDLESTTLSSAPLASSSSVSSTLRLLPVTAGTPPSLRARALERVLGGETGASALLNRVERMMGVITR